jgi:hypothetical protein
MFEKNDMAAPQSLETGERSANPITIGSRKVGCVEHVAEKCWQSR